VVNNLENKLYPLFDHYKRQVICAILRLNAKQRGDNFRVEHEWTIIGTASCYDRCWMWWYNTNK